MSPTGDSASKTKDRLRLIGAIIDVMKASWDTPADCNDGELFTYAEVLFDRIQAGEAKDALDQYLAGVQTERLGIPASHAHSEIVEHSLALVRA